MPLCWPTIVRLSQRLLLNNPTDFHHKRGCVRQRMQPFCWYFQFYLSNFAGSSYFIHETKRRVIETLKKAGRCSHIGPTEPGSIQNRYLQNGKQNAICQHTPHSTAKPRHLQNKTRTICAEGTANTAGEKRHCGGDSTKHGIKSDAGFQPFLLSGIATRNWEYEIDGNLCPRPGQKQKILQFHAQSYTHSQPIATLHLSRKGKTQFYHRCHLV